MSTKRKMEIPPPPADAHNYVLVKTKEGFHWRKKPKEPAKLSDEMKKNNELTGITSPIARRIKDKLEPYLFKIMTGRFIAKVSAKLNKAYLERGRMDLLALKDYEFQSPHTLGTIMRGGADVKVNDREIKIKVSTSGYAAKKKNMIVTEFYYEAILLSGDPAKKDKLRIQSDTSPMCDFNNEDRRSECELSLFLPSQKTTWALILKMCCREEDEPAAHPRHYGMRVIEVGATPGYQLKKAVNTSSYTE